jgi:hypothetical protein
MSNLRTFAVSDVICKKNVKFSEDGEKVIEGQDVLNDH